ncbi:MAG: type II toxin-antitoxin system prevent-host-death family antitoxin [Oscillospiraceae bacterium]|nr:type II toxin-antitoxin system prevent-host-death family antitoxin [Oscillospiraceae bacterium]
MYNTIARPSRDLKNNYADVIRTLKEHNQVLITNNGKGEAVLINASDYAAYEDFLHIRYVNEKLKEAENAAVDPSTEWINSDDFFKKAWSEI